VPRLRDDGSSNGLHFQRLKDKLGNRSNASSEVEFDGTLAEMAGYPRAARAVGNAMASNPIPVVVPCHRVVRSDGSLGRYGDDPAWKERLLDHEQKHVARRGGGGS